MKAEEELKIAKGLLERCYRDYSRMDALKDVIAFPPWPLADDIATFLGKERIGEKDIAKKNDKKPERNLEEEAHQLGLCSWDRADKWLKKRKKKIITLGNPRSDSKDLENLFMDKEKSTWGPGFQKIVDELKAKGHDTNAPKYEIEYLKDDIKWLTKINKKLVKILEEIVENAGVSLIYRNKAIKAVKEAKGENNA